MSAQWNDYRMWYRRTNMVAVAGCSQEWLSEWKPTDTLFRARSQEEAQRKAAKHWRDCQFGAGSVLCVPADEDLRLTLAKNDLV